MSSPAGTAEADAAPPPRERTVTASRVAIVAVVVLAVAVGHYWYGNRHNYYDLRIYYDAISWWADGKPLYTFSHLDPIQGPLGFTYPPFAGLLMYPMAWVPVGVVITVMLLANLAALVITTSWLVIPLADRHGWPRWFVLGLALPLASTLEPVRETVTFGQINLLLAVLVLGDLLRLVPTGSRWAGAGVGLATAIKLTPAIFIVYLLATRRWLAAATATGVAGAATLLAAVVAPHDSWRYWTFTVWEANKVGHLDRIPNQALWGTLLRVAAPHQPSRLLWLALIAVVAGYGLWRAARAARAGDELTGVTLTALVGLLVSPVSWQHHLYWFIPAIVILVDAAASRLRPRVWYAVLAATIWLTVTVGVIALFDYGLPYSVLDTVPGFLVSNWYVLLMLLLIPALPVRAYRTSGAGGQTKDGVIGGGAASER
jgi:alpha-1,2-mannosyltransferase